MDIYKPPNIGPVLRENAATEGVKSGVAVISLVNSDSDIRNIDYPIVANDGAIPSIKFFAQAIANAYKKGTLRAPALEKKAEPQTEKLQEVQ